MASVPTTTSYSPTLPQTIHQQPTRPHQYSTRSKQPNIIEPDTPPLIPAHHPDPVIPIPNLPKWRSP
eukprot:15365959-Ditylum_brightwellii.AAC.2